MKWYDNKNILNMGVGLVGIIAAVIAVVAGIHLLNIGLDWALGVENCYRGIDEICKTDTNQTKRELAQSIAALAIATPTVLLSYLHLKKKNK